MYLQTGTLTNLLACTRSADVNVNGSSANHTAAAVQDDSLKLKGSIGIRKNLAFRRL